MPDTSNGANILVNGGFESTLDGWQNCGSAANTELVTANQLDGSSALRMFNGGCVYQEFPVQIAEQYSLTCSADRTGSGWTIMEMSYLDRNYQQLATQVAQINEGGYSAYTTTGVAPSDTVFVEVLLYSEANTHFDGCSLSLNSDSTDDVVTPEPDPDPVPDPATNLLANGGFENNLSDWSACSAADLLIPSADFDSGTGALEANNGGCMYQEFGIEAGRTYSVNCRAKSEGNLLYTSVSLTHMDSAYATLANSELPVDSQGFSSYSTQLNAPANSQIGSVVLYSEDRGTFDTCVVTVN